MTLIAADPVVVSFSALLPSLLRFLQPDGWESLRLATDEEPALATWGKCFSTEEDVENTLLVLEPLLLLLSVAGYGVPEIAMAASEVEQADVVSVLLPAMTLHHGTKNSWPVAPHAQVGLRVCPTTDASLDLGAELASYNPEFTPATCGWLLLPVAEADTITAVDDLVRNRLWPELARRLALASDGVGVEALVELATQTAAVWQGPTDVPVGASLPALTANVQSKIRSAGVAGVLEAEFEATQGGASLSEQMQALAGDGASLLTRVATRGLVATTAEALWDWWHDDEAAEEPEDGPSLATLDGMGLLRALLSWVGTLEVVDSGAISPTAPAPLAATPLASLMYYRTHPEEAQKIPAADLPFILRTSDLAIKVQIPTYQYRRDPSWRTFSSKTDPYPLLTAETVPVVPTHTLDFARYWFDLGDEQTRYVREKPEIESYINGDSDVKALLNQRTGGTKSKQQRAFKELTSEGHTCIKGTWCAGFTLLALAAAGYDLLAPLVGSNGKAHGYVDKNGYEPIRPYMLIDGQPEATAAMGLILDQCPNRDLKACNGLTVYLTGDKADDTATIRDHSLTDVELKPGKVPEAKEGDVVDDDLSFGKSEIITDPPSTPRKYAPNGHADSHLFQKDSYGQPTKTDIDYDDSAAVRFAPGALELMRVGQRIEVKRMRPGDIGQYVVPLKIETGVVYLGVGHAFQVWAVRVRGPYDSTLPHPGKLVGDGSIDENGHQLFELDATSSATIALDEAVRVEAYRVIEANVSGSTQGLASSKDKPAGDGGISISKWIDFPPPPATSIKPRAVDCTRYYFARLHESPWSIYNLHHDLSHNEGPPSPETAPETPPTPPPSSQEPPPQPAAPEPPPPEPTPPGPEQGRPTLPPELQVVHRCIDKDARLRDGEGHELEPRQLISYNSYVRILERRIVQQPIVRVESITSPQATSGSPLGWTNQANLAPLVRPARPSTPAAQMAALLSTAKAGRLAKSIGKCYQYVKHYINDAGGYGDILDIYQDERFEGLGGYATQFADAVHKHGAAALGLQEVSGLPMDAEPGTLLVTRGNGRIRLSETYGDIAVIAGVASGCVVCINDATMKLIADPTEWTTGKYVGVLVGMYRPIARH